ncbi:MAG TPA: PIN domain-containing protein [Chloroflexota bacterium]|nr:PIN domain-containing protein [Chloroflexota bacterium]
MRYLDTTIIIRYLTQDDPDQAARARGVLERARAGEVTLLVSEAVIVETVNVLSSRVTYNLPRPDIERHVTNILQLRGLRVPHRSTYLRALRLWVEAPAVRDFVDALHVAHMERLRLREIVSFDADFDRFAQVVRRVP